MQARPSQARSSSLVIAALALLAACGGDSPTPPDDTTVATVGVRPGSLALTVGDSTQLVVAALNAAGDTLRDRIFTWTTSNAAVVAISATGKLRAVAVGQATVTATTSDRHADVVVTVTAPTLIVSPASASVGEARTVQFAAELWVGGGRPADSVVWGLRDSTIAAVSPSGRVFGLRAGVVTLVAQRGTLLDSARVTVVAAPVGTFPILVAGGEGSDIRVGDTLYLLAQPRDTGDRHLSGRPIQWSSSGAAMSVDGTGRAVVRAPGEATITAGSEGGSGRRTFTVAAAPAPVGRRFEGCRSIYHVCARAELAVVPVSGPSGTGVVVRGWVENRAYDAPDPARRASLILFLSMKYETIGSDDAYFGYQENSCGGGCNPEGLNTIWQRYSGAYDARCVADPACDAGRQPALTVDFGPASAAYG